VSVPFSKWPTLKQVLHVLGEHDVKVTPVSAISMPDAKTNRTYILEIARSDKTHFTILNVNSPSERATPLILFDICKKLRLNPDIFGIQLTDDDE
jgi:hypothetical protein